MGRRFRPLPRIPLPSHWSDHVQAGFLCAVGLAHAALSFARGWAADSPLTRVRLAAENARLKSEVALLREELRIKDARLARIPARQRPHHPPPERLAILMLRAARGWTAAETARRFLVTAVTISSWMRRLDEQGEDALVRLPVPVNTFPDFVRELVGQLRATVPHMGKVRIAQMLARAGLYLAPTTVRRFGNEHRPLPEEPVPVLSGTGGALSKEATRTSERSKPRVVEARYAHHVWHVDLTIVPTGFGFWVPWFPFAWAQRWPFCWWVGVVLDQYSRAIVAEAVFEKEPTASEVCAMLDDGVQSAERAPRHIISDQGSQFQDEYRVWCKRHGARPRFGAVGQHGSIAVVERFIRSMKDEAFRRIRVPLSLPRMRAELTAYVAWYVEHRPHQGLGGVTPAERLEGRMPARERVRVEPRPTLPLARGEPGVTPLAKRCVGKLELVVSYEGGREHLPVVALRDAA
jgi:transposase InsO family protein